MAKNFYVTRNKIESQIKNQYLFGTNYVAETCVLIPFDCSLSWFQNSLYKLQEFILLINKFW